MTTALKAGMYLLSLWLLFVLIIVNTVDVELCFDCPFASAPQLWELAKRNFLSLVSASLLLLSIGFYFRFKCLILGSKDGPYEIQQIEDRGAEHLVFLATYVIPLVGFGLSTFRQGISLLITLTLLGAIYIRTNLFYANPTLSLLGFRIFNVQLKDGPAILIARDDLAKGDAINIKLLDRRIFFARKAEAPKR